MYILGLCIPRCFLFFKVNVIYHWFHCGILFFGFYARKKVCAYVCFYFFRRFHWKHFRCIFESGHVVYSLSDLSGIILVCAGYLHFDVTFWCFLKFWYHMGIHFWCIRFCFPNFHFWGILIFLGVTTEYFLGWVFKSFFWSAPIGVYMGMPAR